MGSEITHAAVLFFTLRNDCRRVLHVRVEFRTHRQGFSVGRVDGDADEMFAVPKSLYNPPELGKCLLLQDRLDGFLQTLGEGSSARLSRSARSAFFRNELGCGRRQT